MNYEEKYKKALERAKKLKETCDSTAVIGWCEYIFPSLKESEDERIRKAILEHIQLCSESIPDRDKWIAWLEKQTDKPQGKSALEAINEEEVDNANKIEPKFHEGDWVVTDKGDTVQIVTVNNDYYTIGNGMLFNMPYVDTSWHLWTIKDVKKGDVLASGEVVFIFKVIYGVWLNCHCSAHKDGSFNADSYDLLTDKYFGEVQPATKEQRDFLFQKMKEAGYKWNADKKELIKL